MAKVSSARHDTRKKRVDGSECMRCSRVGPFTYHDKHRSCEVGLGMAKAGFQMLFNPQSRMFLQWKKEGRLYVSGEKLL